MPIETQNDADAALVRIKELDGSPKGSDAEAEMVGLIDAVNAFRLRCATPDNARLSKAITTVDEYERATQRIAELEKFPEGTPQAAEMAALIVDVMEWDRVHDDATRW